MEETTCAKVSISVNIGFVFLTVEIPRISDVQPPLNYSD